MYRNILLGIMALAILVESGHADRRKYAWTYQYATIAENESELEFYQTAKLDESDQWEYRIEIEHGLTPKWDLSIYQIFAQEEGGPFEWDAFQVRTRYRLAQQGELPLDPILYLEYRRKLDLAAQNKLEAKLILARDFDRVNMSFNPVYEFFWAPGDPVHEVGIDFGLSYEASYRFCFGIESTSRVEFEPDGENSESSYFGPTISFATEGAFYTIGYTRGITDNSNDARVRFLMGVEL
ncbi:MAG: hypothetical protein AB1772_06250 [Candidatus Zixiibacteriota bacterium]